MNDQYPESPASRNGALPPWLPEARQLASACHGLATRVDDITSGQPATDQTLEKTGKLLHVIGDRLENAIIENTDGTVSTDPVELSLNLLNYAKALPQASTKLWEVDTSGTTTDFGRRLPNVSIALMTLSQQVTETLPGRTKVVRCKH